MDNTAVHVWLTDTVNTLGKMNQLAYKFNLWTQPLLTLQT